MSERGVGNPWTTYEDNILIQAVAVHGENDNWKAVAASVPGRTNKACRKRWLHSLSPNVKKSAWTTEEDKLLLTLFTTHGTKWSVIARNIPGRTDDACSKRYREALDPSLKRDDWTMDEDAKLMDAYSRLGGKWGVIGQELNRSGLGCRNRWRMLERRKALHCRDTASRVEPSSALPEPSSTPSQWSPTHSQDSVFWGRSPQYVTPSALYQGSPPHSQESHGTSYSPAQILSGAHLTGLSPATTESFHHVSASLTAALSQLDYVPHVSSPSDYRDSAPSTPGRALSQPPGLDDSLELEDSGTRTSGVSNYDFEIDDDNHNPETYQHGDGHTVDIVDSVDPHSQPTASLDTGIVADLVVPSDSPASPSQVGSSSPPESPISTAGKQTAFPIVASADSATAPRSYYRTEAEKAIARKALAQKKPTNPQRPARLSSVLPAAVDVNVLAYACGHRDCWPDEATSSNCAFVTSKELSHHSKTSHNGDLGGSKPFRCGLTGCEKSWKSINGLQYHLQISRYHFQQALATHVDIPVAGTTTSGIASDNSHAQGHVASQLTASPAVTREATADSPNHDNPQEKEKAQSDKARRKLHPCPHTGCDKRYKQLSGLRYHLTRGHVDVLPLQLDVVPPTLARIVAEKTSTPQG